MCEIRFYAKPGIDMTGMVPDGAIRMTREEINELMAENFVSENDGDKSGAQAHAKGGMRHVQSEKPIAKTGSKRRE